MAGNKNEKTTIDKLKDRCVDEALQTIRTLSGGLSDLEYKKLGGVHCPFCKAGEACYHENFYKEDIPVADGGELHASTCDTCGGNWFDVIETETGILVGTRHVGFDDKPLPVVEKASA